MIAPGARLATEPGLAAAPHRPETLRMLEQGWVAALLFVAELLFKLGFVGIVLTRRLRRRPSSTVTWIVVILAVPVLGALAYVLVGEVRLGSRRVRRHAEIQARIRSRAAFFGATGRYPIMAESQRPLSSLAETVGGTGPRGGNRLELIGDTVHFIDLLVADIDRSEAHCHLTTYIYLCDGAGQRVAEALERAAGRGVVCRLLVDAVGSRPFLESPLRRRLEKSGVHVVGALPANLLRTLFARLDLRNHRKLAVIDGRVGYTGSQNIADAAFAVKKRFAPWVDAMLRIEGPAVRDLQELFVTDWFLDRDESLEDLLSVEPLEQAGGVVVQVIGTGPTSYNEALLQLSQAAFHTARHELILTTPYFVPDEGTFEALCTAARRGVHTMLVVPARNDSPFVASASRSYYQPLIEAGVEIHEFREGLLHAKTMTVDRDLALISTANFDRRSFELNFEISTLVFDSDFASQLRFLQRSYMSASRVVTKSVITDAK